LAHVEVPVASGAMVIDVFAYRGYADVLADVASGVVSHVIKCARSVNLRQFVQEEAVDGVHHAAYAIAHFLATHF
jgi:hypothetical protein